MTIFENLKKIRDYEWEIPVDYCKEMRVPVRLFASQEILSSAQRDSSLQQAVNVAMLPGLLKQVAVMPDLHQGYGFPIGGVAASLYPDGVISPGGIGYDINCGVRLLASSIPWEAAAPYAADLATALDQFCPSGMGVDARKKLSLPELEQVCKEGAAWALKQGYGTKMDLSHAETGGRVEGANPGKVSGRAKERGRAQLGTLGSGNHFLEVGVVEEIFDETAARAMGLELGCLTLMIHCGSRGLGHQVCTDSVQELQGAVKRYGIYIPDRELVCAPLTSPEGQDYLGAMRAAANYAFANRHILADLARQAFETVLAGKVKDWHLRLVYDVAHNLGSIETHTVDGQRMKLCIHRKGATRAFGPGAADLPDAYQQTGQPVLVPGSMGTSSWVLAGTEKSMEVSFGSSCHGAGRLMSRSKAKGEVRGDQLRNQLNERGIQIRTKSLAGLAEEAPQAYKDVDQVVETVCQVGIARKVARLRPLIVIKG